jgi:hypothetical protein
MKIFFEFPKFSLFSLEKLFFSSINFFISFS